MTQPHDEVTNRLREAWFWSGVLRDHSTFIHDNLAPGQDQLIRWADGFRQALTALHDQFESLAREGRVSGPAGSYALAAPPADRALSGLQGQEFKRFELDSARLTNSLVEILTSLRAFKEELLQRQLDCKVKLHLPPSLISHMIIEADEANRVLESLGQGEATDPAILSLHHHLIWLPDASGHAAALHSNTGPTQKELLETTEQFKQIFDGMHLRALELLAMLRVAPRMVSALRRLNRDSMAQIATFRAFLAELRDDLENCEILGTLVPLFADHMLREELYYTEKMMQLPCT